MNACSLTGKTSGGASASAASGGGLAGPSSSSSGAAASAPRRKSPRKLAEAPHPEADGDPHFADIVDGKLYLFVNAAVFEKYLADRDNILRTAEEKWSSIKHVSVEDL